MGRLTNKKYIYELFENAVIGLDAVNNEELIMPGTLLNMVNKLQKLENKIEDNILIELPCKIGDIVYVICKDCWDCCNRIKTKNYKKGNWDINYYCTKLNKELNMSEFHSCDIDCVDGHYKIIEKEFDLENYFSEVFEPNNYIDNYNKTWFTDKVKAEERLKDLKND